LENNRYFELRNTWLNSTNEFSAVDENRNYWRVIMKDQSGKVKDNNLRETGFLLRFQEVVRAEKVPENRLKYYLGWAKQFSRSLHGTSLKDCTLGNEGQVLETGVRKQGASLALPHRETKSLILQAGRQRGYSFGVRLK
jgi:hypothetical protein